MTYYKLDPSTYFTTLGLAWDAMMFKNSTKLDLIIDVEMLKMVERQHRGDLCLVGKRHVKANHAYLKDSNPEP